RLAAKVAVAFFVGPEAEKRFALGENEFQLRLEGMPIQDTLRFRGRNADTVNPVHGRRRRGAAKAVPVDFYRCQPFASTLGLAHKQPALSVEVGDRARLLVYAYSYRRSRDSKFGGIFVHPEIPMPGVLYNRETGAVLERLLPGHRHPHGGLGDEADPQTRCFRSQDEGFAMAFELIHIHALSIAAKVRRSSSS